VSAAYGFLAASGEAEELQEGILRDAVVPAVLEVLRLQVREVCPDDLVLLLLDVVYFHQQEESEEAGFDDELVRLLEVYGPGLSQVLRVELGEARLHG
jgi:hypothetical protein